MDVLNLEEYRLKNAPERIYYIPNYISKEEEDHLKLWVYKAPKPRWTQLQNRRLQNWGGLPHPKGMIAEKIPPWLQEIVSKVGKLPIFEEGKQPNHVLVNEYLCGQGIMPHLDGPLFYPTISTVNLGGYGILNFYEPTPQDAPTPDDPPGGVIPCWSSRLAFSLYLEPRSLLILQQKCYHHYLHGIEEKEQDNLEAIKLINIDNCLSLKSEEGENSLKRRRRRDTRISLTIRHVPKTTKAFLRLGN